MATIHSSLAPGIRNGTMKKQWLGASSGQGSTGRWWFRPIESTRMSTGLRLIRRPRSRRKAT